MNGILSDLLGYIIFIKIYFLNLDNTNKYLLLMKFCEEIPGNTTPLLKTGTGEFSIKQVWES